MVWTHLVEVSAGRTIGMDTAVRGLGVPSYLCGHSKVDEPLTE
jgi:hypothetical protein